MFPICFYGSRSPGPGHLAGWGGAIARGAGHQANGVSGRGFLGTLLVLRLLSLFSKSSLDIF